MEVEVEFRHKSYLFLQKENQNAGGYSCFVKKIKVNDSSSSNITIVGNHNGTETNRDVVGISIRDQTQLDKFPRGFGRVFPNLKYFEIDNSSITRLYKDDFKDLEHLQGLWMPRNPIVAIPNDLFENVQGLRFLSFYKNKLKYIGHDILKPLQNLKSANFCENTTIDMNFTGDPEQLAALNCEIAIKCLSPTTMTLDVSESKYAELEKRTQLLEVKVRKLETENKMLTANLMQYSGVAQIVEVLKIRIEDIENRNYPY